jgi:hypothetical protein
LAAPEPTGISLISGKRLLAIDDGAVKTALAASKAMFKPSPG